MQLAGGDELRVFEGYGKTRGLERSMVVTTVSHPFQRSSSTGYHRSDSVQIAVHGFVFLTVWL
jgi:hypothetical protein